MKRTAEFSTLFGIVMTISAGLIAPQSAVSQCVAGPGTTGGQIAARNWGHYTTPIDFNSVIASAYGLRIPGKTLSFVHPTRMASDGSNVWIIDQGQNLVFEMTGNTDPTTGQLHALTDQHIPYTPATILYAQGHLWMISTTGHLTSLFNGSASGSHDMAIAPNPVDMIYDGQFMWVSNNTSMLYRVQLPTTTEGPAGPITTPGSVTTVDTGMPLLGRLAFDGDNLWAAGQFALLKLTSKGGVAGTVATTSEANSLIFDGAYLWAGFGSGSVQRIDPISTQVVGTYSINSGLGDLIFDGSSVWAAKVNGNALTKLRSCDGADAGDTSIPGSPESLVFSGKAIWTTFQNGHQISIR